MKKILFFAAAAAAVFATGCSEEGNTPSAEDNAIVFRGVVNKGTRATTVVDVTELGSFFVKGSADAGATLDFMAAPVYREGTAWTYAPVKYFPLDGEVDFYAYHPIKDVNMTNGALNPSASGSATFGYTVPFNQKVDNTAVDLLVSSALDKNSGPVEMTFQHALTGVSFVAQNKNPFDERGRELTFVVHDIRIKKVQNGGDYTYGTDWVPSGTLGDYIAGVPETGVAIESLEDAPTYNLLSDNDIMMVMPQSPLLGTVTGPNTPSTDGAYVQVTWSVKDGEGADILRNFVGNVALPAGFKFDKSAHYAFKFTFGDDTNPGPWGPGNPPVGPGGPGSSIAFNVIDVDNWNPIENVDLMPRP